MPFSSPSMTSAVNEKRRPPLTTLATRLNSTTRSWRSRPAGLMFLLWAMSLCRVAAAALSDGQPGLTGGFGEGLYATVVAIAAAVEHRALDAGGLGALCQLRADLLRLLHARKRLDVVLPPRPGGEGVAAVLL